MPVPLIHQVVHHFCYPIVQNEAAMDLPVQFPVQDALKPGYMTFVLAAGATFDLPVRMRKDIDFQVRSLRLKAWGPRNSTLQPGTTWTWLDLIDVQVFAECQDGSVELTKPTEGSLFGTAVGGMGQLGLTFETKYRSTITLRFTSRAAVDLTIYGHLYGVATRMEALK